MGLAKRYLLSIGMNESNSQEYRSRLKELGNRLREMNLRLRADSETCKQYIRGESKLSLQETCDLVEEMKFYYDRGYSDRLSEKRSKFLQKKYEDWRTWDDPDMEVCGYCDDGCVMCDGIGIRYCSTTEGGRESPTESSGCNRSLFHSKEY
jgi:hypothetical protein